MYENAVLSTGGQHLPGRFLFQVRAMGRQDAKVPGKTVRLTTRLITMDTQMTTLNVLESCKRSNDSPTLLFSALMAMPLQRMANWASFSSAGILRLSSSNLDIPNPLATWAQVQPSPAIAAA